MPVPGATQPPPAKRVATALYLPPVSCPTAPQEREMADDTTTRRYAGNLDEPVPAPDDPGGSRAKGYSADPDPAAPPVPDEDPIPLAEAPEGEAIRPPNSEGGLRPARGSEPSDAR